MPEQEVNPEQRMRLPIRLKADQPPSGEPPREKLKTTEEMYRQVMETLDTNLKMEGAARASRAYSAPAEDEKGEKGEKPSAVRPFQELVEAGKLFGVDFGGLMTRMSEETRALREATDAKDREIHEFRLREYTAMEERIKNAAAEMARVREGEKGKGLGTLFGLDGLDPDVKKRIEERIFGLAEPPAKAGEDSKQPAPFTKEWFDQWGEMRPGIEAFVRMLNYVPREEAQAARGNSQQPLVSMGDIASGKVPLELALGLQRLQLEDKRETLRLEREHSERMARNNILSGIRETIDKNAPDAIAALRDMAREHNRAAEIEGTGGPEALERPRLKGIRCSECGYEFAVASGLEKYTCPSCGATLETAARQPEASVEE